MSFPITNYIISKFIIIPHTLNLAKGTPKCALENIQKITVAVTYFD